MLGTVLEPETGDAIDAAQVTAHVNVIIDLDALAGVSAEPGEVEGVTVSAQAVRDLVAACGSKSTIRRLVTDPITAHLLDVGRNSYAIPDALRRFIVLRDGRVGLPTRRAPARALLGRSARARRRR